MLAFFPCRLLIERRDDLLVPQCLQLFSTAAPRAEAPSISAVPLNCPSGKLLCRLHFYAPTSPQSDYGTESQLFEENILQRCQKERLDEKKTPPLSCTTSVAEGHLQSTWEVSPRCQKNHKQLTVQTGAASEFFQYHRIWGYTHQEADTEFFVPISTATLGDPRMEAGRAGAETATPRLTRGGKRQEMNLPPFGDEEALKRVPVYNSINQTLALSGWFQWAELFQE